MSEPKTQIMTITPQMAAEWLKETEDAIAKGDFRQRTVSEAKVHSYSQDIRNGQWLFNHQGIAFDDNNMIIDGRHRLHAVMKAGKPILSVVTFGLPSESVNGSPLKVIDTIDRGRPRSVAQQLQIAHGYKRSNIQVGVANALAFLYTGERQMLTTYQVLTIIEKIFGRSFGPILDIGMESRRSQSALLLAPLIVFHNSKPTDAENFLKKYISLEGLKASHPVLVLYKWIVNQPGRSTNKRGSFLKGVCSAIMYFSRQQEVAKLYGSDEAREWLLAFDRNKLSQMHKLILGTPL